MGQGPCYVGQRVCVWDRGLLVQHVVHLHSIPTDIVSIGGPQFTFQEWQVFRKFLGETYS